MIILFKYFNNFNISNIDKEVNKELPPTTTSLYAPLLCLIFATCLAYFILLDFITRLLFSEE